MSRETAGTEKWKECLKKHFGGSSGRHWRQIYGDVVCVLLGVKPALLVDSIPPNARAFHEFVEEVVISSHLSQSFPETGAYSEKTGASTSDRALHNLCVIELDQDVLLVNRESVDKQVLHPPTQTHYVDVTRGSGCPSLLGVEQRKALEEKLKAWWSGVVGKLEEMSEARADDPRPTRVPLIEATGSCHSEALNVCTLFGQLLGYPVVYWFHTKEGHSLDMEELVCYSVEVCSTLTDRLSPLQEPHTVLSFSVPSRLAALPTVQDAIACWFEKLSTGASCREMKAILSHKTICLPVVAL